MLILVRVGIGVVCGRFMSCGIIGCSCRSLAWWPRSWCPSLIWVGFEGVGLIRGSSFITIATGTSPLSLKVTNSSIWFSQQTHPISPLTIIFITMLIISISWTIIWMIIVWTEFVGGFILCVIAGRWCVSVNARVIMFYCVIVTAALWCQIVIATCAWVTTVMITFC